MRSASWNTASMSCSISNMARFPLNSRRKPMRRWLSSAPMPAIGSSSNSRRGAPPSAMAISSWRCSPWLRAEASVLARWASPTAARPCRAGRRRDSSRRASARKRKEWPAWACTASATLSRAVNSRSTAVIWKERANPSRTLACVGRRVTSRPAKWMVPESGLRLPVSWLTKVVLPAPLGPIRAWISPGRTSIETESVAKRPPKRLIRRSVESSGSAMTSPEQGVDAAFGVERDQHQHRTEHDLPVFTPTLAAEIEQRRQRFLQREEGDGAVERAEQRAHAAQNDDDDEITRLHPRHHGGRDIGALVGEQDAGQAAEGPGQDERRQPIAEHRKAERRHAEIVRLGAADHQAEARIGEAAAEPQGAAEQREAQPVERRLVAQVQKAGEAAAADVEAVVSAIGFQACSQIVDELGEGQGDHDEIEAARAQRQRADHGGPRGGGKNAARQLDPAAGDAVMRQDAHGIAADAEEHGVAEAHHPAIAQDHVEADGGDRPDDDARADRQQVALVEGLRQQGQHGQDQQQQDGDESPRRAEGGEYC